MASHEPINDPPEGDQPQRRKSLLGNQEHKKKPSLLDRMRNERGPDTQPPRSPTGAVRTASGLTIRAPAEKVAAAFTEVEIEDAGVQWHALELEELYAQLKTSAVGLTSAQAEASLQEHGLNEITPPKQMHWMVKFLLSLVTGFQLMMNVGALLCFIVFGISQGKDKQTLALAIMLIIVVLLTSIFQTYQEGKADKIMEELRALAADKVWVYRDGNLMQIDGKFLAVGDLVKVNHGEKVPADVRIMSAVDLKVNNASLTGENVDIKLGPVAGHKRLYEAKNIARSGCNFTCGNGTGLVFATGDNTFFGAIAKSTTQIEHPDTLMKREIDRLINILSVFAILLGISFGIIAIFFGFTWIEAVAFAIGIIVANVPEGLLSQLVVTLAITAKKLMERDVLVTNLEIIETLGAVTCICSDKTGTLTCNRMTVSHVVYDAEIHKTPQGASRATDKFEYCNEADEGFRLLRRVLTLNTDAIFIDKADRGDDVLKWEAKGDASESALIKFVQPYRDIVEYRAANKRLAAVPFNSTNKWMLSVNAHEEPGKPIQVLVKGAPERVLAMCDSARVKGKVVDMDDTVKTQFEDLNTQLAERGERVLGFAMMELSADEGYTVDYPFDAEGEVPNFPTSGLTFVGFVSLIDPPRPGVKDAVADCKRAGIKVYMVTGDHPVTALAIARSINISTKDTANEMKARGETVPADYRGCIAVHGSEMTKYTQEDWDFVLSHDEIVFARTMPQQKQDIVSQLHKIGAVVAMTGDGVNDAPALKAANVGVAMGSGASVAKEAAQIIVMKDDFGSIVTGIARGRLVFGTLKKVITYVLISNTPEIFPFLFFVIAGIPLGIETIVILTIDLGTDILPAIAMAYEDEESETMGKPPRGADEHLVSVKLIAVSYATIGALHTIVSYFGFFYVFVDLGFPIDALFGAGLGLRDGYGDLTEERQNYMFHMCTRMPKYYEGKGPILTGNSTHWVKTTVCTTDFETYRFKALAQAQAAFFIAIIWGQIGSIFGRKTFTESIFSWWRLTHNKPLLISVVFEIWLALMLIYVPGLNEIFLMTEIRADYFFCTIWYIPLLFVYEEVRKYFLRNWPDGWFAFFTQA